ncbi:hypothetical protein TNCT_474261 [Trichonephila clavata]|uniref:Uncharacterized protein n=1 Tax=Trichonephila clavata TaxID=2740835 RepID=A0A8X6FAZ6_TRICU|nr:hypothetical protein TNCT_474261 [Trichonephila clavata]
MFWPPQHQYDLDSKHYMLEFLEIGPLSFVEDFGLKGKEGFVSRRYSEQDSPFGLCVSLCQMLPIWKKRTSQMKGDLLLLERIEQKQKLCSVPKVHSVMIFKMCQSLGIKARLALEEEKCTWFVKHQKRSKSKSTIPAVKSKMIYEMCNALNIEVVLLQTTEQGIVALKPEQQEKQNKSPIVHSVFVYKMCRALGLDAELNAE